MHAGRWEQIPNGSRVWRLIIQSDGAKQIRLHFTNTDLQGGRMWVYDAAATATQEVLGPYEGTGPDENGHFWTGIIFSDSAVLEYEPASQFDTDLLPFRIDSVSHVLEGFIPTNIGQRSPDNSAGTNPVSSATSYPGNAAAASCTLDVSCYPDYPAKAVAMIQFEDADYSYACTGFLLKTEAYDSGDRTPYFLTNNHCITDAILAGTVASVWGWQTPSCGGVPPYRIPFAQNVGAQLLAGSPINNLDYSLLLLKPVPAGVEFLNWRPTAGVAIGTALAAIGHPASDYKRIAFGSVSSSDRSHLTIQMLQGITQGGSSGSPWVSSPAVAGAGVVIGLHWGSNESFFTNACSALSAGQVESYATDFGAILPEIRNFLAPCVRSVSPTGFTPSSSGGIVTVDTTNNCTQSFGTQYVSNWVVQLDLVPAGLGSVRYFVAPNPYAATRSVVMPVGSLVNPTPVSVVQAGLSGGAPLSCVYSVRHADSQGGGFATNAPSNGGGGWFDIDTAGSCGWRAVASDDWITVDGAPRSGPGRVYYAVAGNAGAIRRGAIAVAGQSLAIRQSAARAFPINLIPASQSFTASGGSGSINISAVGSDWHATVDVPWITVSSGVDGDGTGTINYAVSSNTGSARSGNIYIGGALFTVTQSANNAVNGNPQALGFVSVTPCRVADTRGPAGPFGGPFIAGGSTRTFRIPSSGCAIPAAAQAFSLNVTAIPRRILSYLTLWPAGQPQPLVSTLNSLTGTIVANAAIVPPGANGDVSVFVTDDADVVLDINGYFAAANSPSAMAFYPVAPCRVSDTRDTPGPFGGPILSAGEIRPYAVASSRCGLPANAAAYSMNFTLVPPAPVGYLTTWPAGQTRPLVSTLNSLDGRIVANAGIVPAGAGGSTAIFVSDQSHVVVDANGYFGIPGSQDALAFYAVSPCRVVDTRGPAGTLGGPVVSGGSTRDFPVQQAPCGIPQTARAYSLNITVVPAEPLGFLTAWPAGSTRPLVSTLNALDGRIVANAAIVPAAANGSISVFVTNTTHVVVDINGYFAP